jgi:hypothetical protein
LIIVVTLLIWTLLPINVVHAGPVIFGNTFDCANSVSGMNDHTIVSYLSTDHYTSLQAGDTVRQLCGKATGSGTIRFGLYEVSGGVPTDSVYVSSAVTIAGSGFTCVTGLAVGLDSGKTYCVAFGETSNAAARCYYEGTASNMVVAGDPAWADPFTEHGWKASGSPAIYAVYDRVGTTTWFTGGTDFVDSYISSMVDSSTNYDTDTSIVCGWSSSDTNSCVFHIPNYDDSVPSGMQADSAILELFCHTTNNSTMRACSLFFVTKPYVYNKITWACWQWEAIVPARERWTQQGAGDTGSVINSGDATGDDRGGTEMWTGNQADDSLWLNMPLDVSWLNDKWAISPDSNGGLILKMQEALTALSQFWTSEYSELIGLRPRLRVVWGDVPASVVYTRNKHGHGNLHGGKDEYTGHGGP